MNREELVKALRDAHGGPDGIRMCSDAADMLENDQKHIGVLNDYVIQLENQKEDLWAELDAVAGTTEGG